jgi:hypothetical protein
MNKIFHIPEMQEVFMEVDSANFENLKDQIVQKMDEACEYEII